MSSMSCMFLVRCVVVFFVLDVSFGVRLRPREPNVLNFHNPAVKFSMSHFHPHSRDKYISIAPPLTGIFSTMQVFNPRDRKPIEPVSWKQDDKTQLTTRRAIYKEDGSALHCHSRVAFIWCDLQEDHCSDREIDDTSVKFRFDTTPSAYGQDLSGGGGGLFHDLVMGRAHGINSTLGALSINQDYCIYEYVFRNDEQQRLHASAIKNVANYPQPLEKFLSDANPARVLSHGRYSRCKRPEVPAKTFEAFLFLMQNEVLDGDSPQYRLDDEQCKVLWESQCSYFMYYVTAGQNFVACEKNFPTVWEACKKNGGIEFGHIG